MIRDRRADGILLLDKPAGITSHAAVEHARRILGTRRVGHAGTLDPLATGLLILLVSRATRLLPFLDAEPKEYHATIRFGARTTTDDADGELLLEATLPEQPAVERAIACLTGDLLQRPPAFSAKKVAGVRAYKAARRGQPLVLEPIPVTVYEWRVLAHEGAELDVEICCSGGTYVRALARDLGEAAGSAAHLVALRRTRSGRFRVEDALTLEELKDREVDLLSPATAVGQLPRLVLDDLDAQRVSHGQAVSAQTSDDVVALCHENELLAVAVREGESWRPKVVLRDA